MSTPPLSEPDLNQLRRRARELQRGVRAGVPQALDLIARHLPDAASEVFPLHLAQLALARSLGFASWPTLVRQLTELRRASRNPVADDHSSGPLGEFLRHAVLVYGPDDGPERWLRARDIFAAHPELPGVSLHAAAALAHPGEVARQLAEDPRAANREGGPLRWPPLLYLTYARVRPDVSAADALETTRLLLSAGADPDAGYLWQGQPPPFTALTGVFGNGEQGLEQQPAHPHAAALARVLLAAGAEANDGQTLYNRMFSPVDDHLELLFEFGLGTGDGGPWRRRFPTLLAAPEVLLRTQLAWAITHGMTGRVALLARHGVDLVSPLRDAGAPMGNGLTPVQLAHRSGEIEVARLLTELGAPDETGLEDRVVAALLSADQAAVDRLVRSDPGVVERVRQSYPSLVLRAAVLGSSDAVRLLVRHGWKVDALGRQDVPVGQPWETALHHAAGEGKTEVARTLLALGADPAVRDQRFSATPLGWARFFDRTETIDLLEPLTSED